MLREVGLRVVMLALLTGDIVIPAQILFAVSGYRCLFPNRYKDNVVLHPSPLSSTLVTRVLATFAEVAWIYQFSHVIRLLDLEQVGWVEVLSWLMVLQVVVSQFFVWGAIATGLFIADFALPEGVSWGQQIGKQLVSVGFTALFAPVMTIVILFVLRMVLGDLRIEPEGESAGLDLAEHSETAYTTQ